MKRRNGGGGHPPNKRPRHNTRTPEEQELWRASKLFSKVPGALAFDLAAGLRHLLERRVELINVATALRMEAGSWEHLSCRRMYQEGRIMSYGAKTGFEVTNQCVQPHPLTWIILNALRLVPQPTEHAQPDRAARHFKDWQITFNKYEQGEFCPIHRDWKGLENITYLYWGSAGLLSFHNLAAPHRVIQKEKINNKVLYLSGPSRHAYMHGSHVTHGTQYSMRIAHIDPHVHDIQQKKRLLATAAADTPETEEKVRFHTEAPSPAAPFGSEAEALEGAITAAKEAAASLLDFERAGALKALGAVAAAVREAASFASDGNTESGLLLGFVQNELLDVVPAELTTAEVEELTAKVSGRLREAAKTHT